MRRLVVVLAVLGVAAAGALVWWAARPTLAAVVCRAPDAPYAVRHLSPGMVLDLERQHADFGPGDLSTPTMSQIRVLGSARTSSTPMTVCATRDPNQLLMFKRQLQPKDRCYGVCTGFTTTYFWATSYDVFYIDTRCHGAPSACGQ